MLLPVRSDFTGRQRTGVLTLEETEVIQEVQTEENPTEQEQQTETTSITSEMYMTVSETTTITTVNNLENINAEQLNAFTWWGTAFILLMILIITGKGLYRLYNIFF